MCSYSFLQTLSISFKMLITFFLNKNSTKSLFDCIKLVENDDATFTAYMYTDRTETPTKDPNTTLELKNHMAMVEYIRCVLELLKKDEDTNSFVSVDVMIPGFPNICMRVKNLDIPLIARCLYTGK